MIAEFPTILQNLDNEGVTSRANIRPTLQIKAGDTFSFFFFSPIEAKQGHLMPSQHRRRERERTRLSRTKNKTSLSQLDVGFDLHLCQN